MEFPSTVLISYLEGRPFLPVIRRVLDILLSASLASFIFEHFYFKYQWLDITDYKAELNFFIKGHFFVPFCLFIIIHYALAFISWACFSIFTTRKYNWILMTLIRPGLKRSDLRKLIRFLNRFSVLSGKKLTQKEVCNWIKLEFGSIPEVLSQQHLIEIIKLKVVVRANFQLACKAFVVATVYFFSISYFGIVLFLVTILSLSVTILALYFIYVLLDIWPEMIRSIRNQTDKFLTLEATNRVGK